MNKDNLRKKFLNIRKNISPSIKALMDKKIFNNFFYFKSINNKKNFLFYYSLFDEVDTIKIMQKLIISGKKIALPKVNKNDRSMIFYFITDIINDVHKGAYSIFEPNDNLEKANINEIDTIIVPGVVFDKKGSRIGFGAGYYDKFLNENPHITKIALCYSDQIIDVIEIDKNDVKMDYIITENEIIKID